MEKDVFSRERALRGIEVLEGRIDRKSRSLYEAYECFHDAYIRSFKTCTSKVFGQIDCTLKLETDYTDKTARLDIRMYNVSAMDMQIVSSAWPQPEVYSLYFDICERGVKVSCNTAGRLAFVLTAERVKIRKKK